MSKKISKIEAFNSQNVVTLNQRVTDRRYLILDLWEDIGATQNVGNPGSSDRYRQIFLQINNLKVRSFGNGRIYFDLTDRPDVVNSMIKIEDKIIYVLKNYLAKINKRGRFNFCSIIKDESTGNDKKVVLALNMSNYDYEINMFDSERKRTNYSILNSKDSTFNIILELMYIQFDMPEGMIVIDTRLRLIMQNKVQPRRVQLTDVASFIQEEKHAERNTRTNVANIKQNFDSTHTEVFEDDDDQPNNQRSGSVENARSIPVQMPVQTPAHTVMKPKIQNVGISELCPTVPVVTTQTPGPNTTISQDCTKPVSQLPPVLKAIVGGSKIDSNTLDVPVNIMGGLDQQDNLNRCVADTFSDNSDEGTGLPAELAGLINQNNQQMSTTDNKISEKDNEDNATENTGNDTTDMNPMDDRSCDKEESIVENINKTLEDIDNVVYNGKGMGNDSDEDSDIMINLSKIIKDTEKKKQRISQSRDRVSEENDSVDNLDNTSDVSSCIDDEDDEDDVVRLSSDSDDYDDNIIEALKKRANN